MAICITSTPHLISVPHSLNAEEQAQLNNELILAVYEHNSEKAREVLNKGANPSYIFNDYSPLFIAIIKGYGDIVSILLSYGANPNFQNNLGNSALHLAAKLYPLAIDLLLTNKADPSLPNIDGDSSFLYIEGCGHRQHLKQFPIDPFSKQVKYITLLGKANSLTGFVPLSREKKTYQIKLTGGFSYDYMAEYVKMLRTLPKTNQNTERIEELKQTKVTRTEEDIVSRIKDPNKLTILPIRSSDHAAFLVFYKSFMCICDRCTHMKPDNTKIEVPTTRFIAID
ncbi:MAG: ankyrin repeat domain-containing protein, partial [Chlamydiota bacterium]